MKKDTRQRLFEMMERVNPDFKVHEEKIDWNSVADNDDNYDPEDDAYGYSKHNHDTAVRKVTTNSPTLDLHKIYDVGLGNKPRGLWYGLNDSWIIWAKENLPDMVGKYTLEIDVDFSDMIVLFTESDGKNFLEKYKKGFSGLEMYEIDWRKVALDYKGIEIPDYYAVYGNNTWMWNWDVDSGCIWDLSAIKNVYGDRDSNEV